MAPSISLFLSTKNDEVYDLLFLLLIRAEAGDNLLSPKRIEHTGQSTRLPVAAAERAPENDDMTLASQTKAWVGPNHRWDQIIGGTKSSVGPNHGWDQTIGGACLVPAPAGPLHCCPDGVEDGFNGCAGFVQALQQRRRHRAVWATLGHWRVAGRRAVALR